MKIALFIVRVSIVLLSVDVYAQNQNQVELGVRIMPQATSIRFASGAGSGYDFLKATFPQKFAPYYFRLRAAIGAGIIYYPLKRLRVGADLLYSMQGGGYEQRKTNLDYLKVPLWIGFNALSKRKLIFTIQSGVELSCLIHAKVKSESGEQLVVNSYLRRTSWGIPLAIGVKFKAFSSYFITTQLYVYSDFSSLSKTNKVLGAYNYIYPGLRISIDQRLLNFKSQ